MNESTPVSFPGLGFSLPVHSTAFTIGNLEIKWYGILIAAGLLLAMWYAFHRCRDFHVSEDHFVDIVIASLICGIVGARLYYVLFYTTSGGYNPYFEDPVSIFLIRDGGLGIYGGIIGALLAAFIMCRIKKISVGAVFDLAGLGFPIGQAIGRWGNFFNREAYGAATNAFWRMTGVNANDVNTGYQPCFFFESVWCLLGFILLHFYSKKHRHFNGEIFLLYVMWYGFGRFFIEGLRTDSLMLGNFRVSQLVAAGSFFIALILMLYKFHRIKDARLNGKSYTPLFADAEAALKSSEEEMEAPKTGKDTQKESVPAEKEPARQEEKSETNLGTGEKK